MTLSKSQYIRGLQCHKSLWLYKNKAELRDAHDTAQESLFNTGHTVGELSKKLFPHGEAILFDASDFKGMIRKTQELIAHGTEVIYEATFSEGGIFAMADILVKNTDAWDMYEVKASTEVKEVHLDDVAVQWHALSQSITLNRAYVIHIDNSYVRHGELDVEALFSIADVTEYTLEKQADVHVQIVQMEQMLEGEMPNINIGKHCDSPYACDFKGHCWKHIPTPSVFNISYAMGKQWTLYEQGIMKIEEIPEDFHFGANASLQVKHHKSQEIKIDKAEIKPK